MDDQEKIALYQKLVQSRIVESPTGLIELPIAALQEYHDKVGLGPEQLCYFGLRLPGAEDGIYDYVLGLDCDDEALVQIMDAYYYDMETGESASLSHSAVLEASIYRRYYNGDAMVCGDLLIDQLGRLWMCVMTEDNIGAQMCIQFSEKSFGYEICREDLTFISRLWFDGKTFMFSPQAITGHSGMPS